MEVETHERKDTIRRRMKVKGTQGYTSTERHNENEKESQRNQRVWKQRKTLWEWEEKPKEPMNIDERKDTVRKIIKGKKNMDGTWKNAKTHYERKWKPKKPMNMEAHIRRERNKTHLWNQEEMEIYTIRKVQTERRERGAREYGTAEYQKGRSKYDITLQQRKAEAESSERHRRKTNKGGRLRNWGKEYGNTESWGGWKQE